jgi:two-component system chemotaxis response regulator CheY
MRAMVIDDSRSVRMIIGNYLREMHVEVREAENGVEALARLQSDPEVRIMLVDWNMPQMNGLDLVRAIRSNRAFDAVKILMVTSQAEASDVVQALEAGANEYLMKPFDKDMLVAKLELLDVLPE